MILLPYRAGMLRPETTAALRSCRGHVLPVECADPYDYHAAVRTLWRYPGRLLIVEQDIVPTVEMIEHLKWCQHPACTVPYRLARGELSLWDARGGLSWLDAMPASAPGSGLGCVALSVDPSIPPPDRVAWDWLAESVSARLSEYGVSWHVHPGTVEHLHVVTA